jgi:hypothetical protein
VKSPLAASILTAMLAAWAAAPARADTLRCGNVLIRAGAAAAYVLAKCGTPDAKSQLTEPVWARRLNGTTYVVGTTTQDIWRYERRPGQFPAVLTFEGGVLRKLEFEK